MCVECKMHQTIYMFRWKSQITHVRVLVVRPYDVDDDSNVGQFDLNAARVCASVWATLSYKRHRYCLGCDSEQHCFQCCYSFGQFNRPTRPSEYTNIRLYRHHWSYKSVSLVVSAATIRGRTSTSTSRSNTRNNICTIQPQTSTIWSPLFMHRSGQLLS